MQEEKMAILKQPTLNLYKESGYKESNLSTKDKLHWILKK